MDTLKIFLLVGSLSFSAKSLSGLIDFETLPSGQSAYDNAIISFDQAYRVDDVDITFGFDSDLDGKVDTEAVLEEAGNKDAGNDTGFLAMRSQRDAAARGFEDQLGDFFLRQNKPYKPFGKFIINYEATKNISGASGEIWDIDGNAKKNKTEQFLVEAYDDVELLQSLLSPLGIDSTLDGKPWEFEFSGLRNITRIEISFVGSKTKGIGLAFNNFAPTMPLFQAQQLSLSTSVLEPSGILILSSGLLLIVFFRKSPALRRIKWLGN